MYLPLAAAEPFCCTSVVTAGDESNLLWVSLVTYLQQQQSFYNNHNIILWFASAMGNLKMNLVIVHENIVSVNSLTQGFVKNYKSYIKRGCFSSM